MLSSIKDSCLLPVPPYIPECQCVDSNVRDCLPTYQPTMPVVQSNATEGTEVSDNSNPVPETQEEGMDT